MAKSKAQRTAEARAVLAAATRYGPFAVSPQAAASNFTGIDETGRYNRAGPNQNPGTLTSIASAGGPTPMVNRFDAQSTAKRSRLMDAASVAAGSFPLGMNVFSGARPASKTKNHAERGAIDIGLTNPMTGNPLDSYQNRITAPLYQAMMKSLVSNLSPEDQAQAMPGWAMRDQSGDLMHMQLGNVTRTLSDDLESYNALGKEYGFTKPNAVPSLLGGGYLMGDLQDAIGPGALANSKEGAWSDAQQFDSFKNDLDKGFYGNIMGAPGQTSPHLVGGVMSKAKPGELGSTVQQMPGGMPAGLPSAAPTDQAQQRASQEQQQRAIQSAITQAVTRAQEAVTGIPGAVQSGIGGILSGIGIGGAPSAPGYQSPISGRPDAPVSPNRYGGSIGAPAAAPVSSSGLPGISGAGYAGPGVRGYTPSAPAQTGMGGYTPGGPAPSSGGGYSPPSPGRGMGGMGVNPMSEDQSRANFATSVAPGAASVAQMAAGGYNPAPSYTTQRTINPAYTQALAAQAQAQAPSTYAPSGLLAGADVGAMAAMNAPSMVNSWDDAMQGPPKPVAAPSLPAKYITTRVPVAPKIPAIVAALPALPPAINVAAHQVMSQPVGNPQAGLAGGILSGLAAMNSGRFITGNGPYQTSFSKAYGNQTYGTQSYQGGSHSTLGGGDGHRAL